MMACLGTSDMEVGVERVSARVIHEVGFAFCQIRVLGLTASLLCCGSSRRYQAGTCVSVSGRVGCYEVGRL